MTFEDPNAVDVVVSRHHELDGKSVRIFLTMSNMTTTQHAHALIHNL